MDGAIPTEIVQSVDLQTRVPTGDIGTITNEKLVGGAKARDGAFTDLGGG